jgi:glycosyltransferase involved in cell wall biosynthesis
MGATWHSAPAPVVPAYGLPYQPVPPRIKLLHVITRFAGGAGGNVLLSAAGMDQRRYETWVVASSGGPLWRRAHEAGVRTVQLPRLREVISPLNDAIVLFQLVRLIRRERFTVVHTHSSKAGFLGRLAAWSCRTPVVLHTFHAFSVHDFMSRRKRQAYLAIERIARRWAHGYIAVAPRVARESVELRLARPGSVSVAPSAVEVDGIPEGAAIAIRRELGIDPDTPVVGWVGRLVFQKAPLDFVRMAALVSKARPDVRFVMVGDGSFDGSLEGASLEEETRAESGRLGVDIVFTGFRPDAAAIASSFDVFVISSLYEGVGRALTEAMISGCPVVATAVNGVTDLVEPGSTGLLAPPADPRALADCVSWLLDHPREARRLGALGRARALSIFQPVAMCQTLDHVYSRMLGIPGPAQDLSPTAVIAEQAPRRDGSRVRTRTVRSHAS